MSRTLYDDALAEATQLREMAEQNAKKAIIEAMTPKIRNLIESELSGDDSLNPNDDFLSELEVPTASGHEVSSEDVLDLDQLAADLASMSSTDPGATTEPEPPRRVGGDAPAASLDAPTELVGDEPAAEDQPAGDILSDVDEADEIEVTGETLKMLAALLQEKDFTKSVKSARKKKMTIGELHERISKLSSQVLTVSKVDSILDEASDHEKIRVNEIWNKLVTELKTLRSELICIEGKDSSKVALLKQGLLHVFEEMKEMSNRRNKEILYELNIDELFEGGYDMASEMYEEDDADVDPAAEAVDDAADDDLADVDVDLDEDDPGADPEVVDAVDNLIVALGIDPDALGAEEDLGDEDLGDLEDTDDEGGEGGDAVDPVEETQMSDDDEIIEIDEGMLRRELIRMRRLAEGDTGWDTIGDPSSAAGSFGGAKNVSREKPSDTNSVGDAVKGASSFGGGKSGKEPFADMSDKDLNVYAENRQLRKNLRDRSRKNRALNNQLAEFKKAVSALRSQLSEMNLFNAKLLYANKLLQNKDITNTQLRSMVEALDNAKSLREVKLLYKTLTESIRGKKSSLSESSVRRAVGSSSRPTKSASSDNRSPEVDRWALLAGINE